MFSIIVFLYFILGILLGRHYDAGFLSPAIGALGGLVIGMVIATLCALAGVV